MVVRPTRRSVIRYGSIAVVFALPARALARVLIPRRSGETLHAVRTSRGIVPLSERFLHLYRPRVWTRRLR